MQEEQYEDGDFEEVYATFGSYDPTPADAPGIMPFIPKYLPCERVELSTIIANQGRVGTVIKNQEENPEDVATFGFVSVLNIGAYLNHRCIHQLVEWLQSLGDAVINELLSTEINTLGFFINERAYGIPPEYAPHLNRGIFEEVQWATEDLETPEARAAFNISNFILVKKGVKSDDGLEFPLIEDDFYFKNADHVCEFQTEGEEGDIAELEYHKYVLILTPQSIYNARMQLNEMFGIDESQYANEAEM